MPGELQGRITIVCIEPVYVTDLVTARFRIPRTNECTPKTTNEAFKLLWQHTSPEKLAHVTAVQRKRFKHATVTDWLVASLHRWKCNVLVVPDVDLPEWLQDVCDTMMQDSAFWDRQRWIGQQERVELDLGKVRHQAMTRKTAPPGVYPNAAVEHAYRRIASYMDLLPFTNHKEVRAQGFMTLPIQLENWSTLTERRHKRFELEELLESSETLSKEERFIATQWLKERQAGTCTTAKDEAYRNRLDAARERRDEKDWSTEMRRIKHPGKYPGQTTKRNTEKRPAKRSKR